MVAGVRGAAGAQSTVATAIAAVLGASRCTLRRGRRTPAFVVLRRSPPILVHQGAPYGGVAVWHLRHVLGQNGLPRSPAFVVLWRSPPIVVHQDAPYLSGSQRSRPIVVHQHAPYGGVAADRGASRCTLRVRLRLLVRAFRRIEPRGPLVVPDVGSCAGLRRCGGWRRRLRGRRRGGRGPGPSRLL